METTRRQPRGCTRIALTLLELLVVLIILAIMATVAVQAIQPRVDSARLDATRKSLETIERAVAGTPDLRQPDGTPLIDGFVCDIGRRPRPVDSGLTLDGSASTAGILSELWDPSCRIAQSFPYRFRSGPLSPVDYSDVRLACGWRGPYLQLPVGARDIRDGWGRAFESEQDNSMGLLRVSATPPVESVGEKLNADFGSSFVTVTGNLELPDDVDEDIQVVLLAPNAESSLEQLAVFEDQDEGPLFFRFDEVPVGIRAIVVDLTDRRIIKYLAVPRGGVHALITVQNQPKAPEAKSEQQ